MFAVEKMCKVLKVSRSGYYSWLHRKPSARKVETLAVLRLIREIHRESKGRYGSPKITRELHKRGIQVSRPRVARLMKVAGIRSVVHRKFKMRTTDSNHNYPIAKNLLDRDFAPGAAAKAWVSDITYIRTTQGWLYLTVVVDLADRKVIGWSLSETMKTCDTVIPAWKMAIKNRPITTDLIFHSDRGVQYADLEFRNILKAYPLVTQSMSRKGNCWDNAVAESFFKTLKSELIYTIEPTTIAEAKVNVFEFIEIWYNRKRMHASLGYLTPVEYEEKLKLNYLQNVA
jgi:transposase InsO family protein